MAYLAPTIGPAGLTVPSYNDILDLFITNFQAMYGQNVYLGNDSADFQLLSVLALAESDVLSALQLEYNNRSPNFAIGAALDSLVKLNGIARKAASNSTCLVTLTGVAGTVINNGVVSDVNNNLWNLPSAVTIGGGGTVTITATAQALGPITVGANQITTVATPTFGWTSVTNGSNLPTAGASVETDSQLRARQAQSVELPSISLIAGTVAGIASTPGVTRWNVDENFTGATNGNSTPAHSIQAVVEGGLDLDIATSIYNNKSIGCGTFGSVTQNVIDPTTGVSNAINFNRPTNIPIFVKLGVHQLVGYTSATTTAINNAVLAYLASLQISETVSFSALMSAAMAVNASLAIPVFIIEVGSSAIGLAPGPTGTGDVAITFAQVAQGSLVNVTINFV